MERSDVVQLNPVDRFLDLLRTDLIAAGAATVALGAIAVGFRAWPLLWLCVVGATAALVRFSGGWLARRGELDRAVVLYAVGFWVWSLFAVALVPIGLPVFLFNVLVPVLVASTYLDDRKHRPIALGAVAVVAGVGILGTAQDGMRIEDRGPDWAVNGTIAGFLVGHTWMFTTAVRDGNRTRVATLDAAVERSERLRDSEHALRASRRRVVEVADAERRRIERDLHDGAQQRLVSLAVRLKLASQLADTAPLRGEQLDDLHHETTAALTELRDLASGIYPSLLVERGLADAVRSLCRRVSAAGEATVRWEGDANAPIPDHVAVDLYFVVNEAVQNAIKHGGDDVDVVVDLVIDDDRLEVSVRDNGPGFEPDPVPTTNGLLNMSDRVGSLDGTLSIESQPGEGTAVTARVPVAS